MLKRAVARWQAKLVVFGLVLAYTAVALIVNGCGRAAVADNTQQREVWDLQQEVDDPRQEVQQEVDDLRQEVQQEVDDLRQEVQQEMDDLRQEVQQEVDDLRQEVQQEMDDLRLEVDDLR